MNPKLKQVPLLRNLSKVIHISISKEGMKVCLLMSAIEPYFLVYYLFNFTKHHGFVEYNLSNTDSECLGLVTWEHWITNVLALSSSTQLSPLHSPTSPLWDSSTLSLRSAYSLAVLWECMSPIINGNFTGAKAMSCFLVRTSYIFQHVQSCARHRGLN